MSEQFFDTQPMFRLEELASEPCENGRRGLPRSKAGVPVLVVADGSVFGIQSLGLEGRLTNMTVLGARLETVEPLRKSSLWLRIDGRRDLLECEVQWMNKESHTCVYGIRFCRMLEMSEFKQLITAASSGE